MLDVGKRHKRQIKVEELWGLELPYHELQHLLWINEGTFWRQTLERCVGLCFHKVGES